MSLLLPGANGKSLYVEAVVARNVSEEARSGLGGQRSKKAEKREEAVVDG